MTPKQIVFGTILFSSCGKPAASTDNYSTPDTVNTKNIIVRTETHLRDTTIIKGNFVLFLRPDSLRFDSYTKQGDNIYEADSDFGFAIAATMDSIANDKRYKDIQTNISIKRYIVIEDCMHGPRTIDRDSIDYGLILTSKGKTIKINTSLHSEDYLDDVDEYFKIKNGRQTRVRGQ